MKNVFSFKYSYKLVIVLYIFLFSFGICSGVYLNKIYGIDISFMKEYTSKILNCYDFNNMNIFKIVFSNFKSDLLYLIFIYIISLSVITSPIIVITVFMKGLSIGYTINVSILALKYKSIKIILLIFMKNIIIIPCTLILIMLTFNYILEIMTNVKVSVKPKNKKYLKKIFVKYNTNMICSIAAIVFLQTIVNSFFIYVLKLLS